MDFSISASGNATIIQSCAANPYVQQGILNSDAVKAQFVEQCTATCTGQIVAQVDYYGQNLGGGGLMIGVALPLIMQGLLVSCWRMWTKPTIRAGLLLFAMILSVIDAGVNIAGKARTPSQLNEDLRRYVMLLVIVPTIRGCFVVAAASIRYAAVYTSRTRQHMVIGVLSFLGLVSMGLGIGIGVRDVNERLSVTKAFWGTIIISPMAYIIGGLVTFTKQLRLTQERTKSAGSGSSQVRSLQMANNMIMGFGFAACIIVIVVSQTLDASTSYYLSPTQFLASNIWAVLENAFEIITMIQGAVAMRFRSHNGQNTSSNKGRPQPSKAQLGPEGTSARDVRPNDSHKQLTLGDTVENGVLRGGHTERGGRNV
ncbi:hypothetical protein DFJ77DRAFT_443737 [Powellomyces hirtus]|nr:hypothetical protein DFJ77DRAFT_443737 [Powellomyces hirtus]